MKQETKRLIKYAAYTAAAFVGVCAWTAFVILYLLIADAEGWTL